MWLFGVLNEIKKIERYQQGGDSAAGTQALPVGKIIKAKVRRKDKRYRKFAYAEGNLKNFNISKKI